MSEQDDHEEPVKRTYRKMPEALEVRVLNALMLNIRQYGNERYDLVREHPDYAPWIGAGTGAAGKRRFRRLVDRIVKPMPSDRTKPHRGRTVNQEQAAWADDPWPRPEGLPALPPASELRAGGLPVLFDLAELSRSLQTAKEDIERVRQAALVDDPTAPGGRAAGIPTLLLRTVNATHECAERQLSFWDRLTALMSNNAFTVDLLQLVDELNADDPSKRARFREGIQRLLRKHGAPVPLASSQ